MVRVSEKIKQEMVALYPTHTQKVLARKFNVSTFQVMSIMREAGATKNYRLTDEDRRDITRDYSSGEPIDTIANRYGFNRSYITKIAREGGAKLRKPRYSSKFYTAYVDSGLVPFWGS